MAMMKTGQASCQDADRTARGVIADGGYGQYFTHRLGHSIGKDMHETPWLIEGEAAVLQTNMCFTVEPSIMLPGRAHIRVEDVVVVKPDGAHFLTTTGHDPIVDRGIAPAAVGGTEPAAMRLAHAVAGSGKSALVTAEGSLLQLGGSMRRLSVTAVSIVRALGRSWPAHAGRRLLAAGAARRHHGPEAGRSGQAHRGRQAGRASQPATAPPAAAAAAPRPRPPPRPPRRPQPPSRPRPPSRPPRSATSRSSSAGPRTPRRSIPAACMRRTPG